MMQLTIRQEEYMDHAKHTDSGSVWSFPPNTDATGSGTVHP